MYGPSSDLEATLGPESGRIAFGPGSFKQANYAGFMDIVRGVASVVERKGPRGVAEMYAGAGCIGFNVLSLSMGVEKVTMSDVVGANARSFRETLGSMPEGERGRAEYVVGRAEDVVDSCAGKEMVIVDPPRKGLDKGLVAALKNKRDPAFEMCKTLVYVSCGFKGTAGDIEELVKGGWRVESAEGWCLFVGADHVESLIVLVR